MLPRLADDYALAIVEEAEERESEDRQAAISEAQQIGTRINEFRAALMPARESPRCRVAQAALPALDETLSYPGLSDPDGLAGPRVGFVDVPKG
jgi:hypothetical protein